MPALYTSNSPYNEMAPETAHKSIALQLLFIEAYNKELVSQMVSFYYSFRSLTFIGNVIYFSLNGSKGR